MLKLYPHQRKALVETQGKNKVAYYLDMGLGKTFVGSEKMMRLGSKVNLIICQKSKVDDWIEHFAKYYGDLYVYNLTDKKEFGAFFFMKDTPGVNIGIINYELAFRRPELLKLKDFTLMLDESSLVQNEQAKRSKFIMKLNFENLILLSGTPTGGKYEKLWSQLHMLGYNLSKKAFYRMYVDFHYEDNEGFPIMIIDGYKNLARLKLKMRIYGCVFMKSDEAFNLPDQNFVDIKVPTTKEYRKFRKDCIISLDSNTFEQFEGDEYVGDVVVNSEIELVGDTTLTKMLYERQLCGHYNDSKLKAFEDLVESTNDRLIVFYNFTAELDAMRHICDMLGRAYSIVNGQDKDLYAYEQKDDSVTFLQYQAGAMGLNLQKANKIVYFTPPLSSELFEQSKKRIHRIGQEKPCFYYKLVCKGSIEQKIYATLEMRKDYTEALFEKGEN